jgi:Uncharacterized protein conserved in bacteria (DUF2059)
MKNIVIVLSFLLMASGAFAQTPGGVPPGMPPGMPPPMSGGAHIPHPPMETTVLKSSYPDSTAFNAAFKELYAIIKPTPTIKERTETMMEHMSHMFQARGIDSVAAYDSVMKAVDFNKDEKILFTAYRAQFSAEEIKAMIPFFKTPTGKHYLEVETHLVTARNTEINQYVNQTVNNAVRPLSKGVMTPPSMRGNAPGMGQPGTPRPDQQPPPVPVKN